MKGLSNDMEWEFQFLDWIQAHLRSGLMDTVMPFITSLGAAGWLQILVALLMFIPRRTRKYAHVAAIALLIGLLLCNIVIKPMVARIRPYDVQQMALLIRAPSDFSFPSGHTQASFAVATALLMWKKRYGIPAMLLACCIAFSRMYLYVHYPTDVLAGIFIGVTDAFIGLWICNRLFRNKPWDGCQGALPQQTESETETERSVSDAG